MERLDLDVRGHVYSAFVETGQAPTAAQTAAALDLSEPEAEAAYRRLHDAHALVLRPGSTRILMANPLSAAPTPHSVHCRGRWWFANCAWDALGIPAAMHEDAVVESACADCGEPLSLEVRDGKLTRGSELLVHFVVPARQWWDDIGFT